MDARAKQRLTGAVILVALFVLLVPALLTGPPEAQAPADSANDGLHEYTIDIGGQNRNAQPEMPTPGPAATAIPAPGLAVPGEAAQPAPQPAAPAVSKPGPVAEPETTPRPVTANPVAAAPAASKPVVTPPPAAAPVRAEPARPAATNQRVEPGSFVVQLGTFSSRENAERLTRDMTAKGFAAFVVPTTSNGRELYRVRVGPTRDRASAEALATQLKRVGQSGSIVPIS